MPKLYTIKYGKYSYGKSIASLPVTKKYNTGNAGIPIDVVTAKTGAEIKDQIAVGVITKLSTNIIANKIKNTCVVPAPVK